MQVVGNNVVVKVGTVPSVVWRVRLAYTAMHGIRNVNQMVLQPQHQPNRQEQQQQVLLQRPRRVKVKQLVHRVQMETIPNIQM